MLHLELVDGHYPSYGSFRFCFASSVVGLAGMKLYVHCILQT